MRNERQQYRELFLHRPNAEIICMPLTFVCKLSFKLMHDQPLQNKFEQGHLAIRLNQ